MIKRQKNDIYCYIESLYSKNIETLSGSCDHHMQVSPLEGMIIGTLLKSITAKNVLEIGTLHGYSTAWISKYLGSDAKITTIEKSSEAFGKAKQYLDNFSNIKCINDDAVTFLSSHTPANLYDAIFIDADKTDYSNYLELSIPLLRQGGLLIADNTLMYGEVINESSEKFRKKTLDAIREFNRLLASSDAFDSIIIPTESGLTIAIKK